MHARIPGPSSAHVSSSKPSTPPAQKLAQPAPTLGRWMWSAPLSQPTMAIAHLPFHTLDADMEEKPAIRPEARPAPRLSPLPQPPPHCVWPNLVLSLRTLATKRRGCTLAGNLTTGLVHLLSLPTVCALLHSRHSNKVVTTPKGLHHLAIVGKYNLRTISKSNEKPKGPGTSTRYRLASSSSLQRVR